MLDFQTHFSFSEFRGRGKVTRVPRPHVVVFFCVRCCTWLPTTAERWRRRGESPAQRLKIQVTAATKEEEEEEEVVEEDE